MRGGIAGNPAKCGCSSALALSHTSHARRCTRADWAKSQPQGAVGYMARFLCHVLFRTGRLTACLGTRGRGGRVAVNNRGAVSEGNALQQHLVQTGTPVTTLPDCILYQAFSKTNVPPTDCQRPSTDCTDRAGCHRRARDALARVWPKVALSFPASWGRQAGGQGCPVILGWLGCDHPKRKKGAPCPVACFHNLALNEPPNASAKQVRTGQGRRETTGTREQRLTRIQVRGVAPGPSCAALLCTVCSFGRF